MVANAFVQGEANKEREFRVAASGQLMPRAQGPSAATLAPFDSLRLTSATET
jgi:hypothetical protein